jgi:hypothetical protein
MTKTDHARLSPFENYERGRRKGGSFYYRCPTSSGTGY